MSAVLPHAFFTPLEHRAAIDVITIANLGAPKVDVVA